MATVATSGSYADLSSKPTLGSAAALDVPTTGNASTTQVVKGDDSRLTDSRTPTSHTHTKSEITDFPTLSVAHSGTASTTTVSKETITLGNTTTDVDGSVYMESTANSASFVFTNSTYILSTSKIDVYSSTWGDNPTSVVVDGTNHTCTVTFSSASSRTVGIYIK